MNNTPQQPDRTRIDPNLTSGLGDIEILHPPGTFALTPASFIAIQAIAGNRDDLRGIGLDWGCGAGCLAIAAARIPAVSRIVGLDIREENVAISRSNARLNGVAHKLEFFVADSYVPFSTADRAVLDSLTGRVNFILANPPASEGDDGFGFRRAVLAGARPFLAPGGVVFLNISQQYGTGRIAALVRDVPHFDYGGVIASTDWVPFDLTRPDLLQCLKEYAAEEARGGLTYSFRPADSGSGDNQSAAAALAHFVATGRSPFSKWQTHRFEFRG